MARGDPHIDMDNVTLAYGDFLIQQDLHFTVHEGDIFILMGGSGCGKSTVMRALTGILEPKAGHIL